MLKAVVVSNATNVIEGVRKELTRKGIIVFSEFDEYHKLVHQLLSNDIDLVFWDIDSDEAQGLEIAKKIKDRQLRTQVIFMLNNNSSMLKVLKLTAANYLLKPLHQEQLAEAIENMINNFNAAEPFFDFIPQIAGLREEHIYLINLSNILYLYVEEDTVKMLTEQNLIYKCKHPLKYWRERLVQHNFFQCYRSVLVNLDKVKEVIPSFNSTFMLKFNGDFPGVPVGRKYINSFKGSVGL